MDDCTPAKILQLAQASGLDFATALLYDRVLRHPAHANFFLQVQISPESTSSDLPLIGVVPGAFYRQHKNTGADGSRVAEIFKSMGCPVECLPLESFGSLSRNAALIAHWLAKRRDQRIVLVSLSKGSADMKTALCLPDAPNLFRNVRAWISLSGLPLGTPLVAWLRNQRFRKWGVRLLLRFRGQRYSVVSPRRDTDGPLNLWPNCHLAHANRSHRGFSKTQASGASLGLSCLQSGSHHFRSKRWRWFSPE